MSAAWGRLLTTAVDTATPILIVRIVVGPIFLLEGTLKYIIPATFGVGRFTKIGIPLPEMMAPFVGGVEIVCGILVLLGLGTRLAAIPLMIVMLVAIATTKVPVLLGEGFWIAANMARLDFAMLLSCLFLLVAGAGPLALDARLAQATEREAEIEPHGGRSMSSEVRT